MRPEFIIIGAMKSGTTSLYEYLASHPQLVAASMKETDFFCTDKTFNKGVGWYERLFRGSGQIAFEASPNYTKRHEFPRVSQRMHALLPQAKLIFILRDPIARAVSHYLHNYSYGRELRPFQAAIRQAESNYILTSRYFYQLQAFLDYYPPQQVLLVQAERLRVDTVSVVDEVCAFLGISNACNPAVLAQKYHKTSSKKAAGALERWIVRKTDHRMLATLAGKLTGPFNPPIQQPQLTRGDLEWLQSQLAPDVAQLREFAHCEFADWSL